MSKKLISGTKNITKKDVVNASTGIALKDCNGETITIVACAILEDVDKETGEIKTVTLFKGDDGTAYSAISSSVADAADDIIDIINEDGKVDCKVSIRKSKGQNRDFIALTLI